jgi:hypothetical protein
MQKIIELLKQLQHDRFYGDLVVEFRDGNVVLVRKNQTLKLEGINPHDNRTKSN